MDIVTLGMIAVGLIIFSALLGFITRGVQFLLRIAVFGIGIFIVVMLVLSAAESLS
jgi:hypothetical protein